MASIYNLMILIRPESDFTLSAAVKCLVAAPSLRGIQVEQPTPKRLNLVFDGWRLIVGLEDSPWVQEESREMSERYPDQSQAGAIAKCKSRLSVWSEDPDPDMDHFNDWLISMELLTSQFPGLDAFDPASGEWWPNGKQ